MRLLTLSISIFFTIANPTSAIAQAYKCTVNGKVIYADAPCAQNAKNVGALQDALPEEQRIQRLQQSLKERRERNHIEARENAEFQAGQRALDAQAANEAVADASKRRRCNDLSGDIKSNQRGVARYQDFGWQRSLSQQEAELKRNQEAYDRNCR